MEELFQNLSTVLQFTWERFPGGYLFPAAAIVFFERRDPKTIWTWLLLLYFLPLPGCVLYLLFGQDLRKNRMFRNKIVEDALLSSVLNQEEKVRRKEVFSEKALERFEDLVMYNLEAARAVYTDDNEVEVFTEGREYFADLYEHLTRATSFIHLQSYIIHKDELWEPLKQLLIEKAKEGVEVRILYDGMGCRRVPKGEWAELASYGIFIGEFFPALFKRFHFRLNYRNHRKIVVIDGTTAYVGGFNIGREYVGLDSRLGHWRDTHLRICGSAAVSLHMRFLQDWNYAAKENLFQQNHLVREFQPGTGGEGIQIVCSGPDTFYEEIRNNYVWLIQRAKDHLYLQTPYLIPDEVVLNALKMAAQAGVQVKIMIPCKPDHPLVYWATYAYVGELLEAGVKCYTYDRGFLHAKGMTSDGLVSCYGTANMDVRSFRLNFEVNATIFSPLTTEKLERIFEKDLTECTEITLERYQTRGMIVRMKEQFSRMFSYIL